MKLTVQTIDYREIAKLDPLGYDEFNEVVVTFSEEDRVLELIAVAQELISRAKQIEEPSFPEAMAMIRDLGIVAGAIKRQEIAPIHQVDEMDNVLLNLATRTETVPRDTLFHYTLCNPDGDRMRTYTGKAQERQLIQLLKEYGEAMPEKEELTQLPQSIKAYLGSNINKLKSLFDAEMAAFITEELKSYSKAVIIRGTQYAAPLDLLMD